MGAVEGGYSQVLTRLLPAHSSSWDVSKAKVATGVGGWCGPGGGSCTNASYGCISCLFAVRCIVACPGRKRHWRGIPRPSPPPFWQRVRWYYVPGTLLSHAPDVLMVPREAGREVVSEVELGSTRAR